KKIRQHFLADREPIKAALNRTGVTYDFGYAPFLWSGKVWESLDINYLTPNGMNFLDAVLLCGSEFTWYGESLVNFRAIPLQVLWYVVVPILKPAIISVALFQFMWSMNDFIGPLIYVYSVDKYPIALALKMSIDVTEGAPWNEILAMASISILPSIIVFFLAQRYFVQGVTSSGIKG
ncbi:MAG: hypothetical protein ACEQSN_13040, partial [Yersinia sp. (in: enterobacteria)]